MNHMLKLWLAKKFNIATVVFREGNYNNRCIMGYVLAEDSDYVYIWFGFFHCKNAWYPKGFLTS